MRPVPECRISAVYGTMKLMRWIRVAVALGLAVGLGVTSFLGYGPLAAAAAVLVAALAYGWPRLTDSPQPRATGIMLLIFGLAGMAAVWAQESAPYVEWLPTITGIGLLWAFVQNLARGVDASHAVANVSAQVAGLVIVLSAASWIAALSVPGDREGVVVALVAIILAQAATALPFPARYTSPLALAVAVLGAGVVAALMHSGSVTLFVSLVLGGAMGLLVAAVDRMLSIMAVAKFQAVRIQRERRRDKARRFAVQLAVGATPVALGGTVVYLLERILLYR